MFSLALYIKYFDVLSLCFFCYSYSPIDKRCKDRTDNKDLRYTDSEIIQCELSMDVILAAFFQGQLVLLKYIDFSSSQIKFYPFSLCSTVPSVANIRRYDSSTVAFHKSWLLVPRRRRHNARHGVNSPSLCELASRWPYQMLLVPWGTQWSLSACQLIRWKMATLEKNGSPASSHNSPALYFTLLGGGSS